MPAEMATRQLEAARVQKQVRAWFASFRSASAVVAAPNAFSDLLVHGFLFSQKRLQSCFELGSVISVFLQTQALLCQVESAKALFQTSSLLPRPKAFTLQRLLDWQRVRTVSVAAFQVHRREVVRKPFMNLFYDKELLELLVLSKRFEFILSKQDSNKEVINNLEFLKTSAKNSRFWAITVKK